MGKREAEIVEVVAGIPVMRFDHRARGEGIPRAPVQSVIPLRTETALAPAKKSSIVPSSKGDRRPTQERVEEAERRDALSVALAQPERRGLAHAHDASQAGSWASRLSFPLGRLCSRLWPLESDDDGASDVRAAAWAAGESYFEETRKARQLRGFHTGGSESEKGGAEPEPENPTEEEIEQRKALIAAADSAVRRAEEVLSSVHHGCVAGMQRMLNDNMDPTPYQEGKLKNGLWRLAVHYRHINLGINRDKPY